MTGTAIEDLRGAIAAVDWDQIKLILGVNEGESWKKVDRQGKGKERKRRTGLKCWGMGNGQFGEDPNVHSCGGLCTKCLIPSRL